jgi:hypothetical protein
MKDTMTNVFCAMPCQNDSMCGSAHCRVYDNSATTCSVTQACGP